MQRLGLGSVRWLVMGLVMGGLASLWPIAGGAQATSEAPDSTKPAAILDTSTPDAYFGVTLSPPQRSQLFALRDQYATRLKALVDERRVGNISQDSVRKGIQQLAQYQHQDMIAVLTPEQRVQAEATFVARKKALADAKNARPNSAPSRRVR